MRVYVPRQRERGTQTSPKNNEGEEMTRKDSEKDSERPHYYSQFWLDVAAGRRVIGGPKPDEEEEEEDEEDLGWGGGRGRKKPKPGRQTKLPVKKTKRDTRRGF